MIDRIFNWLKQNPFVYDNILIALVLLLAYLSYFVSKFLLFKIIQRFTKHTSTELDDILLSDKLLRKLSQIVPLLVLHQFTYLLPKFEIFITRILEGLILFFIVQCFVITINSINQYYEKSDKHKSRPIKGYLQIINMAIYIIGGIFLIGLLTGQSPWAILGGVGALTAVLLLVFKDTILSFVASIQITSYDLVKVDDWIEIPSLGVDGDVMDIALHTIKVRNFDKTITVVPTYKLIDTPFKNWRGMQQSGGRRIKRSIFLDLSSVRFCDEEMLKRLKRIQLISGYLNNKENDIQNYNTNNGIDESILVNGRRLTNLGTFREYIKAYLRSREDINKNLTFMVRQLQPGSDGLPLEIYVFTTTTSWIPYEEIQADIFDHIFAVIPEFGLKIFQHPTGYDFRELRN